MLRALHAEPGLAALLGDWMHGDAVIGIRPARVLGADEDPFAALGSADDDAADQGAEAESAPAVSEETAAGEAATDEAAETK